MSILINGMKMPKNCMLCSFCVEEADPANGEMCLVTGRLMPPCNHERLDDCPLIEIPPHGRLIDADELLRAAWENFDFVPRWMVKEAPIVIPADEDGEL